MPLRFFTIPVGWVIDSNVSCGLLRFDNQRTLESGICRRPGDPPSVDVVMRKKSQGGQAQTPPITLQAFESEPIRAPQAAWDVHLGLAAEIENSIGIKLRKGGPGQAMRTK